MILPGSNKSLQTNLTLKKVPVASYIDPYYKYYRQTVRALLTFVLPAIVIVILTFLIIGFIADNTKLQSKPGDSYAFDTIPVPPGASVAPVNVGSASIKTVGIEHAWVPNYNADPALSVAYLFEAPQEDQITWTDNYYQQKLKGSKKWQLVKNVTYTGKVTVASDDESKSTSTVNKNLQGQALYVQGINGQAITGLLVDYRILTAREIKDYPGEYGPKAKDGQIYLVITKNIMRKGF